MTQSQVIHDLLVIGGGINGAGIAADAAGRGLTVVLCEKADLASATSSSSSKLIHGGLRYLEHYEFGLVRKALLEREVLAEAAPHLVKPIAFHIPQLPHSRHPWMLRAGLFLYDNLAKRKRFKGSKGIRIAEDSPLKQSITRGFQYWDAQVDDARLVVSNALQARSKGATILTRTECTAITATDQGWRVTLHDSANNVDSQLLCRAIVNATGPWVASLAEKLRHKPAAHQIRLVKGSHIVVPRIHPGEQAYLLQHQDGRIVFVIPYLQKYSLIGTTEQEFSADLDRVEISADEISYLLAIVNQYFKNTIGPADIVYTYSGVRPLIEEEGKDSSRVSRGYRLEIEAQPHPMLSVYGGKVTTYRVLAEDAVNQLKPFFPEMNLPWTRQARLPGGDFELPEALLQQLASRYSWLDADVIARWQSSYGTMSLDIFGDAAGPEDLGVDFGHGLYQREVDYLCRNEWAITVDDILWRRSKLGFLFSNDERDSLSKYLQQALSKN